MKAYTDLEQSKKLAEILPIESADMEYILEHWIDEKTHRHKEGYCEIPVVKVDDDDCSLQPITHPCWSLASLMELITKIQQGGIFNNLTYDFILNKWTMNIEADNWIVDVGLYDVQVDACVAMIEKLHEFKLL